MPGIDFNSGDVLYEAILTSVIFQLFIVKGQFFVVIISEARFFQIFIVKLQFLVAMKITFYAAN